MRTPLQKGEQVLLTTYSSWVSLIGPVVVAGIGITAAFLIGFLHHYGWIAAVAGLLFFILRYFSWRANIWGVTNFRVIDEAGLAGHFAKESPLEKINNVSYDQSVWGRILNFGHVKIQTAAQIGATDYFNLHHPKKLKDTITKAQADFANSKSFNQANLLASALGVREAAPHINLSAELEKLFELRQKGILSEEEYTKAKSKLLGS